MTRATILHVDLDAFFAAVEQRDRPDLRGRPVVVAVGGPGQRGVVSTASYEARAFGVRSAMPLRTAGALCPHAVYVPVDGRKYAAVSRQVMSILRRYSPVIEPVSIDEAFLDAAGSESLHGSPRQIAVSIRAAMRDELSLTASVGVARPSSWPRWPPTSQAGRACGGGARRRGRLPRAAAYRAPVGRRRADRSVPLAVRRPYHRRPGRPPGRPAHAPLRSTGAGAGGSRERHRPLTGGRRRAGALRQPRAHLRGRHERWEEIEATLLALSEGVAVRLREGRVTAQTVGVKVRDQAFETLTRQRTLPAPTDSTDVIWHTSLDLARPLVRGVRIRLLGVAASHLVEEEQLELFESLDDRRRRATAAADDVRRRFGSGAIVRGRLLGGSVAEPFERDPMKAPEARRVGHASADPAVETKDHGSG